MIIIISVTEGVSTYKMNVNNQKQVYAYPRIYFSDYVSSKRILQKSLTNNTFICIILVLHSIFPNITNANAID